MSGDVAAMTQTTEHGTDERLLVPVTLKPIHLIGGPREWEGGGWSSDNKVLGRLSRPVRPLEWVLVQAIRRADVLAVMGSNARRELIARGVRPERVVVVPAGVDEALFDTRRSPSPR